MEFYRLVFAVPIPFVPSSPPTITVTEIVGDCSSKFHNAKKGSKEVGAHGEQDWITPMGVGRRFRKGRQIPMYIGKMSSIYVMVCNFVLSSPLSRSAFIKVLLMNKQAPQFDEKAIVVYQSHDAAELGRPKKAGHGWGSGVGALWPPLLGAGGAFEGRRNAMPAFSIAPSLEGS